MGIQAGALLGVLRNARTPTTLLPAFDDLACWRGLQDAPALNQTDHDDNDRDDEENVYEPAHRVGGYNAEEPKRDENKCDRPEHSDLPNCRSGDVGQFVPIRHRVGLVVDPADAGAFDAHACHQALLVKDECVSVILER